MAFRRAGAKFPSSMSFFHKKKSRGREQFESLLHVTPYLIFDDGIWVGTNKNTSAIAIDVTSCHVSVAKGTLNPVRKFVGLSVFARKVIDANHYDYNNPFHREMYG